MLGPQILLQAFHAAVLLCPASVAPGEEMGDLKKQRPTHRCTFSESLKQKSHLFSSSLANAAPTATVHLNQGVIKVLCCSSQSSSLQKNIRGRKGRRQTVSMCPDSGLRTPDPETTICLLQAMQAWLRLPPQTISRSRWNVGTCWSLEKASTISSTTSGKRPTSLSTPCQSSSGTDT